MSRLIKRSKKNIEFYVCDHCFNQIDKCTCEFYPPWVLIYVDTGIQEACRILNDKGYTTTSSCESHFGYNPNLYITLVDYYDLNKDIDVPEGFKWEKKDAAICYTNKAKTEEEFEKNKTEHLKLLTEWANSLPRNKFAFDPTQR